MAKPWAPGKMDRDRVAALERELEGLRAEQAAAAAKLADRRERLEADVADLEGDYAGRFRTLTKRLAAARRKLE